MATLSVRDNVFFETAQTLFINWIKKNLIRKKGYVQICQLTMLTQLCDALLSRHVDFFKYIFYNVTHVYTCTSVYSNFISVYMYM